ncbi:MAG: hypothetical protein ABJA78_19615, partial [Ferruginibacter sp.]
MQKSTTIKKFLYKNSYLLVTAAWLITISFIIDNYWTGNTSVQSVQRNLSGYIRSQEKDFEKTATDTGTINKILTSNYDEKQLDQWTSKKYFYFIYSLTETGEGNLVFWNTQTVVPNDFLLSTADTCGFTKLQNGFYVWRKIRSGQHVFIGLIPIKWNYYITNEYLQNSFATGKRIESNYDLSTEPNAYPVTSQNGKPVFYLEKKSGTVTEHNNLVAVWLRVLAMILVLLFVHLSAIYFIQKKGAWTGISFLLVTVFLLRLLSYLFPIPVNLRQFELFDPAIYGSNIILRSLGDLLINSLLLVWVVLFVRRCVIDRQVLPQFTKPVHQWILLTFVSLLLVIATFTAGHVIRTMVADSQIPFDVVNFSRLNVYSAIGFVVLCCIATSYFFCTQLFFQLISLLPLISTLN